MKPCCCGHDRELHQHYRAGTDCARCACRRYRRHRWWHRHPDAPPPGLPRHPPGLPRHDTGDVEAVTVRWGCKCFAVYDGAWRARSARGCPTVHDLRLWDREMQS
jgi:hypothetical protein